MLGIFDHNSVLKTPLSIKAITPFHGEVTGRGVAEYNTCINPIQHYIFRLTAFL